ncbi:hypothetical protein [Fluviicola taffensis]|uniref:Helicase with zn-finger motif n=1 Tax=Fluviicola taffensis (strain DSM 16823 / NCIMB 13979 / RW262) TaxID=755732 RepID=F2IBP8_FLUTR|nr:hypothetical protein [Fluviicola taffensis]AEA45374.1 helicase with zn-finger motif [Fluviicola taffensis DSM 16823]
MKKATLLVGIALFLGAVSCKKKECHDCHYENVQNEEVELGNKCGDDLENLEKNGYSDGTQTYEVHCHEH